MHPEAEVNHREVIEPATIRQKSFLSQKNFIFLYPDQSHLLPLAISAMESLHIEVIILSFIDILKSTSVWVSMNVCVRLCYLDRV